jgi:hypothetical protein
MGAHKKLSSSYKYLEELAELTLCPRWHRKPSHSQVRSVTMQWQNKIAKYAAKVQREKEKGSTIKSEPAPAERRKNVVNNKVKIEEEGTNDKVCPQTLSLLQMLKNYSVRSLSPVLLLQM